VNGETRLKLKNNSEHFFQGKRGGGGLSRETETRDPRLGRREGGGGLEASERLSTPPGGLKHGLEQKGLQNTFKGVPLPK
jgi:hypothetical protein